jgi:hypothetical protein
MATALSRNWDFIVADNGDVPAMIHRPYSTPVTTKSILGCCAGMVVEAIGMLGSRILARDAGSEIGCSKADVSF